MTHVPTCRPVRRIAFLFSGLLCLSAGLIQAEPPQSASDSTGSSATLASQLTALRTANAAQTPPELVAIGQRQLDAIRKAKIVETALQVGDRAPDFLLPNASGDTISSADLLKNGPMVVVFYRGGWCPYCNITLHAMQQWLPAFQAEGAMLVAISPEKPDLELETVQQHTLEFPVLSDHELKVARQFGIAYQMSAELDEFARGFGLDIAARNAMAKPELPLGATYVVDKDGVIRYAYLNVDYTQRAEPADIVTALKKLQMQAK